MTIINSIEIDNVRSFDNDTKKAIYNNNKIEDKLHVIIVLSNPCNYAIRYFLTKEFINRMKEEKDIILYIVELAYVGQDFHITEKNNPRHLQLISNSKPLWHKENLINIGVKKLLPADYKAFAWVDADIEFENPYWASDTLKLLNGYKDVVQLFTHCLFTDENYDIEHIFTGFAFQHTKKTKRTYKFTYENINSFWHPGFAWACTRKFYEQIEGLYEYCITGDSDMIMASCFISNALSILPTNSSEDYRKSIQAFESKANICRLGYVHGTIKHHYHGSLSNRNYDIRNIILMEYNYSPTLFLKKDENGLLIFSENCPDMLITTISNHFHSKNEDSVFYITPSLKPFIMNNTMTDNSIYNILNNKGEKTQNNMLCTIYNVNHTDDNKWFADDNTYTFKNNITVNVSLTSLKEDLKFILRFIKTYLCNDIDMNIDLNINIDDFYNVTYNNVSYNCYELVDYCRDTKSLINAYLSNVDYYIVKDKDIVITDLPSFKNNIIDNISSNWDVICVDNNMLFYIVNSKSIKLLLSKIYPFNTLKSIINSLDSKLNVYYMNENFTITKHIIPSKYVINADLLHDDYENLINILNSKIDDLSITNEIIQNQINNNIIKLFDRVFPNNNNKLESYNNIYNNDDIRKYIYNIFNYYTSNKYDLSYFVNSISISINNIINSLTDMNIYNEYKPLYFGSTANVYQSVNSNLIAKVYINVLRWSTVDHSVNKDIFNKELTILSKLNLLESYDKDKLILYMKYYGKSLYQDFNLPNDWEEQIINIFKNLINNNICYTEFNLNNILVLNNKITFIDYGLCKIINKESESDSDYDSESLDNSGIFIELLKLLNNEFKNITSLNERQILYNKFIYYAKRNKYYNNIIY